MKKITVLLLVLLLILPFFINTTFAVTSDFKPSDPGQGTVDGKIQNKTQYVWATVVTIVQIASVAAVVFAGLRYLFSSADQRADIKQGLIYLSN